ncbi:MAG: glucose-6-phosphate dehydrogenase assembly protein OpcA [Propionibacteriaceae bacterium]
MIVTLKDTNAAAISAELSKVRRNLGPASGLVLTLVVVTDSQHYQEALEASLVAGKEHPSRILLVIRGAGEVTTLDAELRTGEGVPGDVVTLHLNGELVDHDDSVVLPLLLPDLPVVVWWPNQSPEIPAQDRIGKLANRRITDASGDVDHLAALRIRAEHHAPGDTDLTWTRLTPWRALLAAALDQFPAPINGAVIEAAADNAPAELMAAWLESRLGCSVTLQASAGPGITAVRLHTDSGDIAIVRVGGMSGTYEVPGQPQRTIALKRRDANELLTEELRRMDTDDIFDQTCQALLARQI